MEKTQTKVYPQRTFSSNIIQSVVEYYHERGFSVKIKSYTAIPEEGRWYSHNYNRKTEVILAEQTSFTVYTGNDRYRVWIFNTQTQVWEPVMI